MRAIILIQTEWYSGLTILEQQTVDIAIVDIMMAGMDGFELCQQIKLDFDLPVIMLTARDALTDKERAFKWYR